MGTLYFVFMMFGVFTVRVPREGWKPENWTPPTKVNAMITTHNVEVNTALALRNSGFSGSYCVPTLRRESASSNKLRR